ncbi:hypothetical protein EDB81DRAFT_669985 [Dactylonectria macrodidyma]|uniref:Chromo domain-containing protein n=1 Tax=Dactylonectria macrodidyma TaxID=307937 RepID=A0A9P9IBJ4_9HYPO|nr:hypothetical protein EDB81DRAFT_669985 [Dactylonectria macrodidyma]
MMTHLGFLHGVSIETPWSSSVAVREVLAATEISGWKFYGVRVENKDQRHWDWLDAECLLWVFDDGGGLRMWQEPGPRPLLGVDEPTQRVEQIIGHYQSRNGMSYVAIKWKDSISPTWEIEQGLESYADIVTNYFTSI